MDGKGGLIWELTYALGFHQDRLIIYNALIDLWKVFYSIKF